MKKEYIPHPIDTSDVSLPASLEDLAEEKPGFHWCPDPFAE